MLCGDGLGNTTVQQLALPLGITLFDLVLLSSYVVFYFVWVSCTHTKKKCWSSSLPQTIFWLLRCHACFSGPALSTMPVLLIHMRIPLTHGPLVPPTITLRPPPARPPAPASLCAAVMGLETVARAAEARQRRMQDMLVAHRQLVHGAGLLLVRL